MKVDEYDIPFIFVHIPKNAGSAITRKICNHTRVSEFSKDPKHCLPNTERQHLKISDISKEVNIEDYYKFCCVRNPFDRAISQCLFLSMFPKFKSGFRHEPNPNNKKAWEHNFNLLFERNDVCALQDLGCNQLDYIKIDGEIKCEKILRFESLLEDWSEVKDMLNIPEPTNKVNVIKRSDYKEFYTPETKKKIAKKYEEDLEYFKYTF